MTSSVLPDKSELLPGQRFVIYLEGIPIQYIVDINRHFSTTMWGAQIYFIETPGHWEEVSLLNHCLVWE